jgi:hypothetical protein
MRTIIDRFCQKGGFLVIFLSGAAICQAELDPKEARAIAHEAYVWGFPLVDSCRVQHSYFVEHQNKEYKGEWNVVHHVARVYTPEDKAIQTPNSDTPYSFLGADLRAEPLVISVPDVDPKRYYSLQLIDQYTYNFAYIGSRATGSEAGRYLLVGPDWSGEKPQGIKEVIQSETQFAFVLYRTQLFSPSDLEEVKKLQASYQAEPLSTFLGQARSVRDSEVEFFKPLSADDQKSSPEFFTELNFILQFCPAHPAEKDLLARFEKLGIGAGKSYDPKKLSPELLDAVKAGIGDAWAEFAAFKAAELDTGKRPSSDGFGTREFMAGDYLGRMAAAVLGIYGNSKEEALYPAFYGDSEGKPMSGNHSYVLRLPPGQLPPVNSFWSLTLYQLPESLLYANPLNRYLINSPMLGDLKRDSDGGITLYIQHESPSADLESNWLPAPAGPFWCIMRLYWPKPEALDGTWKAPVIRRVK